MRQLPLCVVALMFLLVPTTALANDHVARIAGGYSKKKSSDFNGGHGSVEVALPFLNEKFSIVVDSSIHQGTDNNLDVTKATALGGLRRVWRPKDRRVVVFAHFLAGYHRSHVGSDATDHRAFGPGVGFDYLLGAAGLPANPTTPGAPVAKSGWILSLQGDMLRIAGENTVRINLGVGYRYR